MLLKVLKIFCLIGFALINLLIVFYVIIVPRKLHSERYKKIEIGMQKDSLLRLMSNSPQHTINIGNCTVLYYYVPSIPISQVGWKTMKEFPAAVHSLKDLPDLYNAQQILLDDKGEVVAFTWIGETTSIETICGPFDARHGGIRSLPPNAFQCVPTSKSQRLDEDGLRVDTGTVTGTDSNWTVNPLLGLKRGLKRGQ